MSDEVRSQNLSFVRNPEPQLDRLAALAERYFSDDPVTSLIKLRQFAEELARQTAARSGLLSDPEEAQADLLRHLRLERTVPPAVLDLFHQIRVQGNRATHQNVATHGEALNTLKIARQLGIWFYRSFTSDSAFKPGPFTPPPPPRWPHNLLPKRALLHRSRPRSSLVEH